MKEAHTEAMDFIQKMAAYIIIGVGSYHWNEAMVLSGIILLQMRGDPRA